MVGALQYRSGPTWTDETTAANNATANDMNLFHTSPTADDAYYFGGKTPFKILTVNVGTAGVGTWTLIWEYYNGSIWVAIPDVYDGTGSFKKSGSNNVSFSPPSNWAQTTLGPNSITCYWIRARLSVYSSMSARPLGTQSWTYLQILNATTDETYGKVTGSYSYGWGGSTDVYIKARKGTSAPKYIPLKTLQTIGSTGLALTVSMSPDEIA